MRRREFIISLLSVMAPEARAQQSGRVQRIGFLRNGPPPRNFIDGLRQGLREHGFIEHQNVRIEYGLVDTAERLPEAAAKLVEMNVDIIVASGTPPTVAAKNATRTIPVVFVASIDPIATGVVEGLSRPGANVTGFAGIFADVMGKRLELMKEVVPGLSQVAILGHATNPGNAEYIRQAEIAAPTLGLSLRIVTVRDENNLKSAFRQFQGPGAVVQLDDVFFTSRPRQIVELAASSRVPVMYGHREFMEVGGLISYGVDLGDQYRRSADYVARILRGEKPADLPVQQPTKLELLVNLKTARAIGLEIPPSVLTRADEVIE
ncbi:MAG TPA: ABC transporter substrate-binding protein [Nitrospiraceae bacterium]|nr:ABC transporter substrate-binding protein [Nitrospiraceae bacterium]